MNPTIAAYEQKIQGSSSHSVHEWMSQLAFSLCWNSLEVGSNVCEEMNLLARLEQAGKEQGFLLPCPLYRLSAEVMAQIRDGSFYLKDLEQRCIFPPERVGLKVDFPISNSLIKQKSVTGVPSLFWILVSDVVKLTAKTVITT